MPGMFRGPILCIQHHERGREHSTIKKEKKVVIMMNDDTDIERTRQKHDLIELNKNHDSLEELIPRFE